MDGGNFHQLVLFAVSAILLTANPSLQLPCMGAERQALLRFKQVLVDDYGRLSYWESEEDCCRWREVGCSNRTGHATVLDLRAPFSFNVGYKYLKGNLSPSLLELQHLKYLDLSGNQFMKSIPKFLGSFPRLQYLNLSFAGFSGPIPNEFQNLSKLQYLDLSSNFFLSSGKLEWLSHLSQLSHLDLSYVNLSEALDWSRSVSHLPLLKNLYLKGCKLPDIIPHHQPLPLSFNNSSSAVLSVLDLSSNDLSSSIYNWLFNFNSTLVDINIYGNQLKGPIPDAFGEMISLRNLDLGFNRLEGVLPKSFANLSHLQSLYLSSNYITDEFSKILHKLSRAKNSLKTLDFAFNQVGGSFFDFTEFTSLIELNLCYNQLSGSFPETFAQIIPNLVFLDLSGNQITGSLPDLSVFPSLTNLELRNNHLNGTVHENIGLLSKLEVLDAAFNSLEGVISEAHLSNLSNLLYLEFSSNKLAFNISPDWVPPFQLGVIALASCKLGPHLPNWLQTQKRFHVLDISNTEISGNLPSWFWDVRPNVNYLNVSYNQISGFVPDLSSKFLGFPGMDLSFNLFTGPIPLFPPNITFLNLSKNKFVGSLAFLCTITGEQLSYLDLSSNLLSGELPECWEQFSSCLSIVSLAHNNLTGKIPVSIGSLQQLETLHLRDNEFQGEVPSLKNCTLLKIIDLSANRLTGEIPAWIGTHLPSLIVLSLKSNDFQGSIPPSICHLNHIQILDLSQNSLSGKIADCVDNFTALVQVNSSNPLIDFSYKPYKGSFYDGSSYVGNVLVQWKGHELEYSNTLGLLKSIDLSSNKLQGEIPQQIETLAGLVSLNLSRNWFTGKIMEKMGHMKMLESLDLSENRLSGEISKSIAQLNYLSVLDLSDNNLSGRIPSSTQLQSFNASSFEGNPGLCGLPLPIKCPGDETHGKQQKLDENEDEEELITLGFYISMGLGFIVGFWGLLGTIFLNSHWRYSYFSFLDSMTNSFCISMARLKLKGWIGAN
ncbi:Non-specific serine/threonine protein kinase [Bertholletia excelsa]